MHAIAVRPNLSTHLAGIAQLSPDLMQPVFHLRGTFEFASRHANRIKELLRKTTRHYLRSGLKPKCNTSHTGRAKIPITSNRSHVHVSAWACIGKIAIMK